MGFSPPWYAEVWKIGNRKRSGLVVVTHGCWANPLVERWLRPWVSGSLSFSPVRFFAIIFLKPEGLMLQNATPLRKSAPWPPNMCDGGVSCTALPRKMHEYRSSSNVPRLPSFLKLLQNPHVWLNFAKVQNPSESIAGATKMPLQRPKVLNNLYFCQPLATAPHGLIIFDA